MLKHKYLWPALVWTAVVGYLCLVNFNELPKIGGKNFDKIGHLTFHFGLTTLWYLYFRFQKRNTQGKALLRGFGISFTYGVLLEIVQATLTDTRSGDVMDVLANSVGGLLAVLLLSAVGSRKKAASE